MSAPNARPHAATKPSTPAVGETRELSNYRLLDRRGQEELATIYRAVHQTLDRPVEVHILRRTDWISSARFQLAGRIGARLNHANILPVIDAGRDEKYGDYIVTPRLEASTLDEILSRGPLGPVEALRITTQIGSALQYLQGEGIVHRDLRPGNILITKQNIAYLTNFSLAAAPETPDLSSLEEADFLTVYSSPELRLVGGTPNPNQDIFGLGAVLYHMLAGVAPVPGKQSPALLQSSPELAAVDRVIRRMMANDPAQRFQSADQAIAALRQTLRKQVDDATEDMNESRWEPVAEWLENPLEAIVGDMIDHEYISKSRARADGLHRVGAITRQLDRWSRNGFLRRPALGQLVTPEQIVSYNIYFYELRVWYETRTPAKASTQKYTGGVLPSNTSPKDVWEIPVEDLPPFTPVAPQAIVIPHSQRLVQCETCKGATQVPCKTCDGKGNVERTRRVRSADGTTRDERYQEVCQSCRGYGRVTCPTCEGSGQLIEEKSFTWSRSAKEHFNEDDISGLHKLTLEAQAKKSTELYKGHVDLYHDRWGQVAPLQELVEAAIKAAGEHTRIKLTELTIRGVPVTEVDFQYKGRPHTLSLIGFDDEVRGDRVLFDTERSLLYAAVVILILVVVVLVVSQMF
jgi:serine/threonine protein kinase